MLLGLLCESAVSVGRGFPWDILKVGCVAQSKLKLIQQAQRTLLADVIVLLSYKPPERFTPCLCICAPPPPPPPLTVQTNTYHMHTPCSITPHAVLAVTDSLHLEMGSLVYFTVNRVGLSSSRSEFMQLCNYVLLMAKAASLLCESHREVRLKGFSRITAASFYSVSL